MVKVLILTLSLLITLGCSKKEVAPVVLYTQEEFDGIMNTTSATADKNNANAINYSDYSPGVDRVNSKAMIYERLSFAAIAFETEKQAKDEALRLNQYYSRNWLFDKVEGEPLLEDLVISRFHAANPKRRTQRKPVNIPPMEHHEGGGGGGEHH
jgi:hypothetical protein